MNALTNGFTRTINTFRRISKEMNINQAIEIFDNIVGLSGGMASPELEEAWDLIKKKLEEDKL